MGQDRPLPSDWAVKAAAILRKFQDKEKLDLTDVSHVILADFLGHGNILTVDVNDFSYLRWGNGKQLFQNLLYPN
jgi:predicted nucleic acid-binding protein